MSQRLLRLACWLMIAVLPLDAVGAESFGMMTTIGTVIVDNRPAAGSSVVFAGDVIETGNKSKAVVAGKGRTVSVGENSSVRLGAKAIELQSGAVLVTSTKSVVQSENFTITTDAATPAKFLARKINGELQVLALEGTVYVSDGQQTTPVPATKGVKFPKAPGRGWSWLLNDDIGILIVVAAAITAGVTLGIVNAKNAAPVSPAVP